MFNRRGGYGLVSKMQLIRGRVIGHPDGFGFMVPDEGGDDLFAHFSEIQGKGFRSLAENQRVEFEVRNGPKGLQAAAIRPL